MIWNYKEAFGRKGVWGDNNGVRNRAETVIIIIIKTQLWPCLWVARWLDYDLWTCAWAGELDCVMRRGYFSTRSAFMTICLVTCWCFKRHGIDDNLEKSHLCQGVRKRQRWSTGPGFTGESKSDRKKNIKKQKQNVNQRYILTNAGQKINGWTDRQTDRWTYKSPELCTSIFIIYLVSKLFKIAS